MKENETLEMQQDSEISRGISRRKFLTVGALATAAVASSSLVGCGSGKTEATTAVAISEADPIAPVGAPASWDYQADVVVCGTGGGLVGAVRAAQLGAKVVVLEKTNTWGGASKETDLFSVVGTKTQQALYGKYAAALATAQPQLAPVLAGMAATPPETLAKGWVASMAGKQGGDVSSLTKKPLLAQANTPLLNALGANIPAAVDWLGDQGVKWDVSHQFALPGMTACLAPAGSEGGGFVARANMSVFKLLNDKAVAAGVQILFQTPATALVVTDGKVVGVQAKTAEGKTIYVKANKGVLLATGGMTNNKDMLSKYVPSVAQRCLTSTAGTQDTGDGIRMGLGAGAEMAGFDSSFVFDGGIEATSWNHYLYKGDVQLARQPWFSMNIEGNRHPYYTVDDGGFTLQCGIHMVQPGHRNFVFFDANYETSIKKFGQLICRNPIVPEMAAQGADFSRLPEAICEHDWRIGAKQGIDAGYIHKANTIPELAKSMGIDEKTLQAGIDKWNAICKAGVDNEYGYKAEWLIPVKDAPFYGMAVGGTVLSTLCGLHTNAKMQVMSTKGLPIAGLYASGANLGGASGDSSYGACRNPGGGVAYSCGTAWAAVNAMLA